MGYVVRQTLPTERSAAPKNITSMINLKTVASSADAKSVSMSPPEVVSSDPSYTEKHVLSANKVRVMLDCADLLCCRVVLSDPDRVSFCALVADLSWWYLYPEKNRTSVKEHRWRLLE